MQQVIGLLFCLIWSLAGRAAEVSFKFVEPVVLEATGPVEVKISQGKSTKATRKLLLRERATIETGESGWALIALTKTEKLVIGPQSRVMIPVIAWENGAIERLELEKGKMRLMNLSGIPRVVVTPLSRDSYSEVDMAFEFDSAKKSLQASVIEGRTQFRGQENEDFFPLEGGEKATFQATLEKGEITSDVLLQGRRVIRGKMSEKEKLTDAEKDYWVKAFEKIETKRQARVAQEAKESVVVGGICTKPSARLNDCSWICEHNPKKEKSRCRVDLPGVKCVRLRCDANGEWADRRELPALQSPCQVKSLVKSCDY